MNIEPAQQVPVDDPDRPACRCHDLPDCPEQATVEINAAELAHVAELLDLIDGFLRSGNGIADRLTDYLQTTARDPRTTAPPGAKYNANLVIDLVSFTAHARIRPADGSQMAVQIMTVLRATRQSGVIRLDNEGFWDAQYDSAFAKFGNSPGDFGDRPAEPVDCSHDHRVGGAGIIEHRRQPGSGGTSRSGELVGEHPICVDTGGAERSKLRI